MAQTPTPNDKNSVAPVVVAWRSVESCHRTYNTAWKRRPAPHGQGSDHRAGTAQIVGIALDSAGGVTGGAEVMPVSRWTTLGAQIACGLRWLSQRGVECFWWSQSAEGLSMSLVELAAMLPKSA